MGAFAIYNDCNTDSTIISNLFIDEYMKNAGEVEIKVYLYLVRMMSAGRSTSIGEMSALFGCSESEAGHALLYWESQGLLALNRDARNHLVSIHLCPVPASAPVHTEDISASTSVQNTNRVVSIESAMADKQSATTAKRSSSEVALYADEDKSQILCIIEQYVGKPLSPSEMQTVYYIADELHFSNDLIDYLVQYCVERGKKDFRYIEKVAINWRERGIQTTQDAQKGAVEESRTKRSKRTSSPRSRNSFTEFEQNTYDFEALEKALLSN